MFEAFFGGSVCYFIQGMSFMGMYMFHRNPVGTTVPQHAESCLQGNVSEAHGPSFQDL